MRIFIATPCQGQLSSKWFTSFLETFVALAPAHQLSVFVHDRDNFIARARNSAAMNMLKGGFDKLFFIDSDQNWTAENVFQILNSDKKIVGGTYPHKKYPLSMVFNALEKHEDMFSLKDKSMEAFYRYREKYADANGEVEVKQLPTGFMMIDRRVLEKMVVDRPKYWGNQLSDGNREVVTDFFPCGIVPTPDDDKSVVPIHDYDTEDWGFCRAARASPRSPCCCLPPTHRARFRT